ncbi:MAG: indolepyruvate oxidoreductase subunit beta [Bacteroidaceae bacterium]|nr:indolepyruvate oxidoreductase subunit beta [Bacteroidaceae bacterium]MBR1542946.1 indolepyruvate oxidoreductase subunit beta [Bacteroidaceae bacterium]
MKKDIKLSGVGGQGILSIATVIGEAATEAGLHLKQAEVHGMSQRGGDVQSDLRLSTDEIFSDQISLGKADLIISMEPMEAMRYLPYLSKEGVIVTSSKPFVNIPNYPDEDALLAELDAMPHVARLDIEQLAKDNGIPKSANMILLGMATRYVEIISAEQMKQAIRMIFNRKGEQVVNDNLKAFNIGYENIQ